MLQKAWRFRWVALVALMLAMPTTNVFHASSPRSAKKPLDSRIYVRVSIHGVVIGDAN